MTDELKPCPFCEGPAGMCFDKTGAPYVGCVDGCMRPLHPLNGRIGYDSDLEAIVAWNRRALSGDARPAPSDEDVQKAVERFKEWRNALFDEGTRTLDDELPGILRELLAAAPREATTPHPDTTRLNRLINVLKLAVMRDEPGKWTCWLDLPCFPTRSQSNDVREIIDAFAHFDAGSARSGTAAPPTRDEGGDGLEGKAGD